MSKGYDLLMNISWKDWSVFLLLLLIIVTNISSGSARLQNSKRHLFTIVDENSIISSDAIINKLRAGWISNENDLVNSLTNDNFSERNDKGGDGDQIELSNSDNIHNKESVRKQNHVVEESSSDIQSPRIQLQRIWKDLIEPAPTADQIKRILRGDRVHQLENLNNRNNDSLPSTPLLANGTDKESLYRQMLAQFLNPVSSSNTVLAVDSTEQQIDSNCFRRRSLWLDQEFALNLKGSAVLAHHPELLGFTVKNKDSGKGLLPKGFINKGIRIRSPPPPSLSVPSTSSSGTGQNGMSMDFLGMGSFGTNFGTSPTPSAIPSVSSSKQNSGNTPTGLSAIQDAMARALAHSLNSDVVYLNHRSVDTVASAASKLGLPRSLLSKTSIVSALFELLHEEQKDSAGKQRYFTVILNDSMEWLLHNEALSSLFLKELRSEHRESHLRATTEINSENSRIFFIAIEPDQAVKIGHTIPSAAVRPASSTAESNVAESMTQSHLQHPGSSFPFPPYPGLVADHSSVPKNLNPNQIGQPIFPPAVTGRSFQVTIRNGTATMTPLPPGSNGLPPGLIPAPPEAVIKRMMADHHRMMQQHMSQSSTRNGSQAFSAMGGSAFNLNGMKMPLPPIFPPDGMTPEEFEAALQDPENQAKMKGLLDKVMEMASVHLSEHFSAERGDSPVPGIRGEPVDIRFHMMQVPMPMPMNADGTESNSKSVPTEERDNYTKTYSPDDRVDSDKLPGKFFKGMTRKSPRPSDSNNKGKKTPTTQVPGSKGLSISGREVLSQFQEFILEPPRDHGLRLLWERFAEEEIGARILKFNRRLLQQELKRSGFSYSPGALRSLQDILSRQVMSRSEVRRSILAAVKLQAGKFKSGLDQEVSQSNMSQKQLVSTETIELSHWALDSAISAVLKVPSPRLGKPVVRSKDQISELAIDKHEKALVANVISPQDISVTYDMIGGLNDVKEILQQSITYPLKYPRLYQEGVAAEAVKGVLLFGPPGTGKTMLAKAVATEGGATFMSIDTSTIENKWLGESEKNARAVFTLARRLAPCVIYLDEVDSILSSRENGDESSHGTLTSVKTTLMQEWDGLRTTKDRVVVIASTNRPFDLDEAVLRRLPRRILVDLPDLTTRTEILQVTLSGNRVAPDVNMTKLAERLEGYTGSDIKEVCREAVVRVAHERARMLENGAQSSEETVSDGEDMLSTPLRPVSLNDFEVAMKKLKASVDDNGRELAKVVEWNEKYGEFKRSQKSIGSNNLYSMYV